MSGGQAAVASLQAENVQHVFGLIGSATMEMFDALYDASEINFIGIHDERTGTHMADGYARASGNAGVVLARQNGPGATNLVTGLAQGFPKQIPLEELTDREQYNAKMLEQNLMFGSPEEVIAKLKRYEALGVDEFIYYASMGLGQKEQKRSLELFCSEVMPAFE